MTVQVPFQPDKKGDVLLKHIDESSGSGTQRVDPVCGMQVSADSELGMSMVVRSTFFAVTHAAGNL